MANKVFLKDLRELEKNNNVPTLVEYGGMEIEVKQFIGATEKGVIVDLVVENSILELDKTYDKHVRNIMETYLITKYYTNINVNDNPMEMYDLLIPTGIYDVVVASIPNTEIQYLRDMINHRIEEEKGRLAREGTFVGVIERLVNSIDIDKMAGALKEFDPSMLDNLPKHDLEILKKK